MMKNLRCTYRELLELPAIIYQDAVEDANAASSVSRSNNRWKNRR